MKKENKAMDPKQPPPTTLLRRLINLDTTLSLNLYTLTHPILPYLLLKSLEISGDGFLFFPLLLSLLLFPPSSSTTTPIHPLLYNLLIGGLLDLLFIGVLKHIFRRPRPVYNKNMSVAFAVDHFSFPSGHSSRVFFVATFVHLNAEFVRELLLAGLGEFKGGNVGFFISNLCCIVWSWAGLTSVSRVLLGRHFVLDVVVGMSLGVLNGMFVFRVLNFENLSVLLLR